MEKIKQQRRCVMAKWIIHSKYYVRMLRESCEIEADTEQQALDYYYDNVWGTDKDIVVKQENIDDSDETLKVKQMK